MIVHIGQLLIVIGAIWAWWGNWAAVGLAPAFLVLSSLSSASWATPRRRAAG